MTMFTPFDEQFSYPDLELRILEFWKAHQTFEKSVHLRDAGQSYTFYEGPPTVNGMPGIHHVMARTLKDLVCRYKTMRGYQVHRKAGWDTHGLPIELALERNLGFNQKSDIEAYGVSAFNAKAKDLVYHHIEMSEGWRTLTERMGYWINLDEAYITCTNEYIESVWWALQTFYRKGLIYKGFKIVPQCPHCETPLSSHELALGYKDVRDMNLYVTFRCLDEDASFLVWTTTPWTLISNVALTVHPDIPYVKIRTAEHGVLYLAEARLSVIKEEYEILSRHRGSELVGKEYEPLFTYLSVDRKAWYVVAGSFVTTEDGTGIVHTAPAFGVDDYEMLKKYDLPFVLPVTPGGRFTDEVTDFAGRLVKTIAYTGHTEDGVDPEIVMMLKQRGRVYRASKDYEHSYPHCWRCDNPLIYYARDSWYIRTTEYAARMIELNKEINWCPPEVGSGRFGNWLEENKDWSLSRDRYWGTPLPIWVSEDGTDMFCVGSIDELMDGWIDVDGKRIRPSREEIDLHKPFVDRIFFERDGKLYRRTPELIDVWFDSGAMPFAQYHYPFEHKDTFEQNFPSDFISEGIDQTRGWFYTLHAISSALFDAPAFRNVIVNELILDKTGQKMSKSKGNVVNPFGVIERYGADATRWYLITNSPPWRQTMFNEDDIEFVQKNFFRALINTYQFFTLYANLDGFSPDLPEVAPEERPEIDRWILSEFHALHERYQQDMDAYDLTSAARAISDFTIDQLSNWYVRRNRRRFWKGEMSKDKCAAYQTLYTCVVGVVKLMAPVCPFLAEELYQKLQVGLADGVDSVHLALLPAPGTVDAQVIHKMRTVQRVVGIVRNLREKTRMKTRQPLQRILVASSNEQTKNDIAVMKDIILEETNIKEVEFIESDSALVTKTAKPNFKAIGPTFGKRASLVASAIKAMTREQIDTFEAEEHITLMLPDGPAELRHTDIEIQHEDIAGWTIGVEGDVVVALDTTLTEDLIDEGHCREFISRMQNLRKDRGCALSDRILVRLSEVEDRLATAILKMKPYIQHEILASDITLVNESAGVVIEVNGLRCLVDLSIDDQATNSD